MTKRTKKQIAKAKVKVAAQKIHVEKGFDLKLIGGARKVGFSFEQIAAFATKEDLIQAVNQVKPNTIPPPKPIIEKPAKSEEKEKEIEPLILDLNLTPAMAKGPMRVENENRSVKVFLARNGIRGVKRVLTCVDIHRSYDKPYHTKVTISYRERAE